MEETKVCMWSGHSCPLCWLAVARASGQKCSLHFELSCLAECGRKSAPVPRRLHLREENCMQFPHRLLRFRFFDQKRDCALRSAVAKHTHIHVRYGGEDAAGYLRLSPDVFAHQAD